MMELRHEELLRRLEVEGCAPQLAGPPPPGPIESISWDDREGPRSAGELFVAVAGARHDSHPKIPELRQRGFAAFIGQRPMPLGLRAPYYRVRDSRRALAILCQMFAGDPASRLSLFGVTGTNGKSTSVRILASILSASAGDGELSAGWMSTVNSSFEGTEVESRMTTPDPEDIARALARFEARGGRRFVLEVSSHALDQGRVAGLGFTAGLFTNLTRDHYDYHGGEGRYLDAKLRLFEQLTADGTGVIPASLQVEAHPRIRAAFDGTERRLLRFADHRFECPRDCDAWVSTEVVDTSGIRATLQLPTGPLDIESSLVGRHNLENILGAATVAADVGIPPEAIQRGIAACPAVRGRLQRVDGGVGPIFVDYAHTPDALRSVLGALREATPGRLIVVFGCGGDRDSGKRPVMGRIACKLADRVIVTSDNPRTETPAAIVAEIVSGARSWSGHHRVDLQSEVDRARAIARAVLEQEAGDTLLVAGKGHETYQEIGSERIPFDDVAVIRQVLAERRAG
ncbi:MAG: UDP-N-acetylmuramoyl-L-alanyl-D-glutamate--2,6-diaminopimelate ligase [Planctomycetes bacterium]|nr:UDP-N-acetylmuramoyl-L-alanyl-D-glutamate--2,6-diaminopimelate ligase [Planctomycetota bacterium]